MKVSIDLRRCESSGARDADEPCAKQTVACTSAAEISRILVFTRTPKTDGRECTTRKVRSHDQENSDPSRSLLVRFMFDRNDETQIVSFVVRRNLPTSDHR